MPEGVGDRATSGAGASESPATGSSAGPAGPARASEHAASRTGFEAFLPLEKAPPLAGLAALAAFAAMLLNQVLLPGLGSAHNTELLSYLGRYGQFAANLATISGSVALVFCLFALARGETALTVFRRVLWVMLSVVLLRAAAIATFWDRAETTRENVYLAVGAANMIGVLSSLYALERTRGLLRVLALLLTCLPLFSIASVLLEVTQDFQLDQWRQRGHAWTQGLGELCYVGVLLASFPMLVPRGLKLRDLIARTAGIAVLVASVYALRTAEAALHNDYPVLFYHAQRVGLMLDRSPLLYAVPFCLSLSAVTTALIASNGARWQAAAGVLLLFAAGYAPKAPGRLLSMALGFVLLSRALIALTQAVPRLRQTPTPTPTSRPTRAREPDVKPSTTNATEPEKTGL
jgi:hypothetical protein